MKTLPLFLSLCLLFVGCATATINSGRDFDATNVSRIAKGTTTVAEIEGWAGQPYSRSTESDGAEKLVWFYAQTQSHAKSYVVTMKVNTTTTGKRLSVTAKDGIVQDFSYTEGPVTPYAM